MTKFLHQLSLLFVVASLLVASAARAQAPTNDDCLNAIDLNTAAVGGAYFNYCSLPSEFTSVNATAGVYTALPAFVQPTCFGGSIGRDVWFKFTTNNTDLNLTVSIIGGTLGSGLLHQPQVAFYREGTFGCPADGNDLDLECARAAAGGATLVKDFLNLDPLSTYYIRINDYSASATPNTGLFQLCLKTYVPRTILDGNNPPTVSACTGVLVDDGNYGNYSNSTNETVTLTAPGSGCMLFTLDTLNILGNATFNIYNGSDAASPVLAALVSANNSNNPRQYIATSGSVTIRFIANAAGAAGTGFVGHWSCAPDCAALQPCSAIIYDPSGPTGNYANNLSNTVTYCPNAPGRRMQINFHNIDLPGADNFTVYDGNSAAASSFGAVNNALFSGPGADYTAIASVGNTSGCLTIVFTSDAVTAGTGYDAQLQCNKPCQTIVPTLLLPSTIPSYPSIVNAPPVPSDSAVNICLGQNVTVFASATYPQNNTLYPQNDLSSLYYFNWGDGGICGLVQPTSGISPHSASHVYNSPGIFRVRVTVADPDSLCGVQAPQFLRVRVLGKPQYQITAPQPICLGESVSLSSAASGSVSVLLPPPAISSTPAASTSGTLCVPDYPGGVLTPFVSPVTVANLSNLTLNAGFHIKAVYAKFQHTYMGDLDIQLRCPNNSSIVLKQYGNGTGGNNFYGIANDNLSTCSEPAQGLVYGWNGLNTTTVTPLIFPNCLGGNTQPDFTYCSNCPNLIPPANPNYVPYTMRYFPFSMNAATTGNLGITPPAGFINPYPNPFAPSGYVTPGFFNSFDPMSNLNGCPVNGTWSIEFTDHLGADNGIIYEWGIIFDNAAYPNLETYSPTVQAAGFLCNPTITNPANCSPIGSIINQGNITATPTTTGIIPYAYKAIMRGFPACAYFDTLVNVTVKPTPTARIMRDSVLCQATPIVLPPPPCNGPVPFVTPNGPSFLIDDINSFASTVTTQSSLSVSIPGNCAYVVESVQVNGVYHDFPPDIDMYLQSPTGQRVMLMSDVGGSVGVTRSYKFKMSTLAAPLPSLVAASTTPAAPSPYVCAPTNIGAADPGVPAGITTNLNTFTGNMNGAWLLKVTDGFGGAFNGDVGSVANWSITFATAPPTYASSWSTTETTEYITVNTSGTYTVTITEINGCTASESAVITVGSLPAPTPVSCSPSPGSSVFSWAAVSALPAVLGYEVSLDNSTWINNFTSLTYTTNGITQGSCDTLYVRAIGSCPSAVAVGVCCLALPPCLVTGTVTNATCGGADGSIALTSTGAVGALTYFWTTTSATPATGANPANLAAGTYTVVVTDANGCSSTATFSIATTAAFPPPTVSCGTPTQTSVTFNWTAVAGAASYEYSLDAGATWISTNTLTFTNTPMVQGQTATILVRAASVNTCPAAISLPITCTANACSVSGVVTDATCTLANGSILLTPVGLAPFTYTWAPALVGSNPTGLASNNYVVTVTDGSSCTSSASFTVANIGTPLLAPTVTCGQPTQTTVTFNWSAVANAASYEYSFDGGATWTPTALLTYTNTGMLLGASSTIQVRGVGACTAAIATFTCTACGMTAMLTPTATTCSFANGVLTAMPMGVSVAPIAYVWSDVLLSGANPMNVAAGTYTVTLTDAVGCTNTASATVAVSTGITLTFDPTTQPTCGLNNASTTVVVAGGIPQTYLWSDVAATAGATLANGNNGGTYTVTVTSTQSCVATASITFNSNFAITGVITPTNVTCFGANDGVARFVVFAGNGGYTYSWSNGTSANPAIGLAPNTYTVTVTDGQGCTRSRTVTITEPAAALSVTVPSITNTTCFGLSDGGATAIAIGGSPSFTYAWDMGTTPVVPNTVIGLNAGTHTVNITDLNGCTTSATFIVTQPLLLTATASATDALCNAAINGTITAAGAGGTGVYAYAISGATNTTGATTGTFTGLGAGTYIVSITDANLCTTTASATVTEPAPLTTSIVATPVSCFGGNDGTATVTAGGGTTPYSYLWDNTNTTALATGLMAGSHTVLVTDGNSCSIIATIVIIEPTILVATIPVASIVNPTCANMGLNGSAMANATGGTAPYTYIWDNASTLVMPTNLATGTHTVTITDGRGCTKTATLILTPPILPIADIISVVQPSCGANNGGMTAVVTNAPVGATYTYAWNGGIPTNPRIGLGAGNYTVIVTDNATQCKSLPIPAVPLNASSAPLVSITRTSPTCVTTASLCASTVSGVAPYFYTWSTTGIAISVTCIAPTVPGTYTVTVVDNAGCTSTSSADILPVIVLNAGIASTNVSCNGLTNGTATATVSNTSGGTITYAWSNGTFAGAAQTGLAAGTYTVTMTDVNTQCSQVSTAYISAPQPLTPWTAHTDACIGQVNGTITATTNGGTTPYASLNWTGTGGYTGTGAAITVPAGTYTLVVTDANGCTAATTDIVYQPAALGVATTNTNVCNGATTGTITAVHTAGTYTYNWTNGTGYTSNSNPATGAAAGTYTVTVTDANGCATTATAVIYQPAVLGVATTNTNVCNGATTGTMTAVHAAGTYTYNWANGLGYTSTSNPATGAAAGTYTVTVTDVNGCATTATAVISEPAILGVSTTVTGVCNGATNGTMTAVHTAGTYTYNWTNGTGYTSTSNPATGAGEGTYTVTATDANGCATTATAVIYEPAVLGVATTNTNVCNGATNGTMTAVHAAGVYTYNWTNGGTYTSTSNPATGAGAGTYTVTVRDANNCATTATAVIYEPAILGVATTNTNVCNGATTGTMTAVHAAGIYTYNWTNGGTYNATSNPATGAGAGTYTVTVRDANNCATTATAVIYEPAALGVSTTTTKVCNGATTGTMTAVHTAGTYTYNWTNGGTYNSPSNPAIGAGAGTYTVTVTDVNGCATTANAVIYEPAVLGVATTTTNVCFGATNGTMTAVHAPGTYTYAWSDGGTYTSATSPAIGAAAGTYTVTVTDANGCATTATAVIFQPTAAFGTWTQRTNAVCFGQRGSITAVPFGGYAPYTTAQYAWTGPNGFTQTGNPLANVPAGIYTVVITDTNGCTATASDEVQQPSLFTTAVSATLSTISVGGSTVLTATPVAGATYMWTVSGATNTVTVSPLTQTTYTVLVTNAAGCSASASTTIAVLQLSIQMPNFFTPNGDTNNDTFFPVTQDLTIQYAEFTVYNRWGQVVHSAPTPWDGTFDGAPQAMDTYVYVVRYTWNGESKNQTGDFMLIR